MLEESFRNLLTGKELKITPQRIAIPEALATLNNHSTASSYGTAKNRMEGKEDMKCYDWFFCTKEISKEKVLNTITEK